MYKANYQYKQSNRFEIPRRKPKILNYLITYEISKVLLLLDVPRNRPFPSCCKPQYESEAKCKAFHMKISFVCI